MADDSFVEPKASEEPYTRIKTLGRGAFGEAVLYRKTEVRIDLFSLQFISLQANIASKRQHVHVSFAGLWLRLLKIILSQILHFSRIMSALFLRYIFLIAKNFPFQQGLY